MATADDSGYVIPPRFWAWLGTRRALRVLLWLVALSAGAHHVWHARNWMSDSPTTPEPLRRADGSAGHAQIDFGGQWLMGRMLVRGHGRELYHRQRQWEVVREGFPVADESPAQRIESITPKDRRRLAGPDDDLGHDADRLMSWFMGTDPPEWKTVGGAAAAPLGSVPPANPFTALALNRAAADAVTPAVAQTVTRPAVGGPLYPPVQAFYYAPLGLIDRPQTAYAVFQVLSVLLAYLAGLGVCLLSRGRIWWSVASCAVLWYPGCRTGLDLGQNHVLTLTILIWGWVLAARGRDWAGGAVWGLLAFKPVWAVAFFLVPLLMRRWRFALAMAGTGTALGALTLPVVGLQAWFDWLAVGREASRLYGVNQNWVHLSRDLHGLPRRFLLDFAKPEELRENPTAAAAGWALWGLVFAGTAAVYLLRADRRQPTGLGAGFLFLGAFLTCYRFMYYDALLSFLAVAVLLADPWRFFRTRVFELTLTPHAPALPGGRGLDAPAPRPNPFGPRLLGYVNSFPLTVLGGLYLVENLLLSLNVQATVGVGYFARETTGPGGSTGLATPRVEADTTLSYPWDTALLLLLWGWCGLRLIVKGDRPDEPAGAGG